MLPLKSGPQRIVSLLNSDQLIWGSNYICKRHFTFAVEHNLIMGWHLAVVCWVETSLTGPTYAQEEGII